MDKLEITADDEVDAVLTDDEVDAVLTDDEVDAVLTDGEVDAVLTDGNVDAAVLTDGKGNADEVLATGSWIVNGRLKMVHNVSLFCLTRFPLLLIRAANFRNLFQINVKSPGYRCCTFLHRQKYIIHMPIL